MPLKDIKAKHTKSDISLLAWDSRLKSYNMSSQIKQAKSEQPKLASGDGPTPDDYISPRGVRETDTAYVLPEGINNGVPIPKAAFDENGDIDLRRLPGHLAAKYIRGLGIPLAIVPYRSKK